ncbi:hypothetical protein CP532_2541 [Ophiocordyceps camponoti-leonardi (nom. inval.)]|nr:hypothetical protein CP532_2541 [Ophiocordyceps camponoti-leonardi (nom. inval.)]
MVDRRRKQPGDLASNPDSNRTHRSQDAVFVPPDLDVRRPLPTVKSKHRSYFEFVQNTDKKKKLEFQNSLNRTPPPGFEFVPVGNPELTSACKELSRDRGLKIYIVAVRHDQNGRVLQLCNNRLKKCHDANAHISLATQMNRVGYHFHANVVREARTSIRQVTEQLFTVPGIPEPIPESQSLYYTQADAVLRDLFPRIPNTDRQRVILHSFTESASYHGERRVGRSSTLTLSRRVQLAVLAHIRHTHTTYDDLLKRMPWNAARKAVQPVCLDILVKWRGDEESGRDQLDEILREVVIISDSEDEDATEDSTDDTFATSPPTLRPPDGEKVHRRRLPVTDTANTNAAGGGRNDRRGFERYRRAWEDAVRRSGETPRHDRTRYFHDGDGPAFRDALEPRMAHDVTGNAPAPNGYVPPALQVYRAEPRMTAPNDAYQEVDGHAHCDEGPGLRLPRLPPGSSSLGTGPERPLAYENRSKQYYFGSSPSPAQPPRENWRTDGHAHPGGLRAMSPVQTSGCRRGRYDVAGNATARVQEAPASDTRPAAERIIVNTARPGSRLNSVVMEQRGGYYERVADHESAELLQRSDGVPRPSSSSVTMNAQERVPAGPGAEPGSYRSPSTSVVVNCPEPARRIVPTPPWRVDRRLGFVSHVDEEYRPVKQEEESRYQQFRSDDARLRHQQPRQDVAAMDDECIFIRQRPLPGGKYIDLTL